MVFDKTGTLTKGEFGVSHILPLQSSVTAEMLLEYAASLEVKSEHPIAKSIVDEAKKQKVKIENIEKFKVLKGIGVSGFVGDVEVKLVNEKSLNDLSDGKISKSIYKLLKKEGIKHEYATKVYVLVNNQIVGLILLEDQIRQESYQVIKLLQSMGIKCYMLTADNKYVAQNVSEELNLDGYFAEVLPHEKQEKIKELQNDGEFVAMVGDGINDAPALALADVGIAIGSGTDIAAETADVILVNNNPQDVAKVISFGKATYRKMVENLFWATGYNAIAIPLAAGVFSGFGVVISPAFGAALMSLSTVIVAINAKRLRMS